MFLYDIICEVKDYQDLPISFPDGIIKCTFHYIERGITRKIDLARTINVCKRAMVQYPDIWPEITTRHGSFVILDSDGKFGLAIMKTEVRRNGIDGYEYYIKTAHPTLKYWDAQQIIRLH